jgi:hypothetical protein
MTKDLRAKIRQTKELRPGFLAGTVFSWSVDGCAASAHDETNWSEAQGWMSQGGCGFLGFVVAWANSNFKIPASCALWMAPSLGLAKPARPGAPCILTTPPNTWEDSLRRHGSRPQCGSLRLRSRQVLRLRNCFASRSSYSAQDDKTRVAARVNSCPSRLCRVRAGGAALSEIAEGRQPELAPYPLSG